MTLRRYIIARALRRAIKAHKTTLRYRKWRKLVQATGIHRPTWIAG